MSILNLHFFISKKNQIVSYNYSIDVNTSKLERNPMFWALDFDPLTTNHVNLLRELYPNEKAMSFAKMKLDVELLEKDGSSPTRISCCAHGGFNHFANYSPEELSNEIVTRLLSSAAINPEIKKSLTDFDLLGCQVGCDNGKDEVYTSKVSRLVNDRLAKEGFNPINFKAISNKILGPNNPFHVVYIAVPEPKSDEKTFLAHGHTSEKDWNRYWVVVNEIKSLFKRQDKLLSNPGGGNLTIEQEMVEIFKRHGQKKASQAEHPYVASAEKLLEDLAPKRGLPAIDKDCQRLEILLARHVQLIKIKADITVLGVEHNQCSKIIHDKFTDPRKVVDQYPGCNFTKPQEKNLRKENTQFKDRYREIQTADPVAPTSRAGPR
jgi:hypothetical protein